MKFEKNLDYERAEYAYKCIKSIANQDLAKEYRSALLQTPDRIYNAGLLQTLAFYCSKMKDERGRKNQFIHLNLHLMKWILRYELTSNKDTWTEGKADTWQLYERILRKPENKMLYTERALSVIVWMKRFAED